MFNGTQPPQQQGLKARTKNNENRNFLCVVKIAKGMEQATLIYALYLGIDLENEKELLAIASQALQTLPSDWQLGFGDKNSEHPGVPYFYNTFTEESTWTHPKEAIYFDMVVKQRAKQKNAGIRGEDDDDSTLQVEEFEEWDAQETSNEEKNIEHYKFGSNEGDFDVEQEKLSLQGNHDTKIARKKGGSEVTQSGSGNFVVGANIQESTINTREREEVSAYYRRRKANDGVRIERDKLSSGASVGNSRDDVFCTESDEHDTKRVNRRKKDNARKSRSGEKKVQSWDLMDELHSLSSLNKDLEKEIQEIRYEGEHTFDNGQEDIYLAALF